MRTAALPYCYEMVSEVWKMKKRMFSLFLVLALLLAALAGCGQNGGGASNSAEEEEQLLARGYYEVYDEDDELVGYLRVTGSKITVYDSRGNEEDVLRYDYDAKKALYSIDGGELFDCGEFTVEQSKKALTLITEDDDEYTLEEIDKDELPGGEGEEAAAVSGQMPGGVNAPNAPDSDYIELPAGCYAAYDGLTLMGYLKVTENTIMVIEDDGYLEQALFYSYERDGSCTVTADGETFTFQFTYERGSYYMSADGQSLRLEPVSESEIPVYTGEGGSSASTSDAYFIGDNGSIALYAWLPEELYGELGANVADDGFTAVAQYYDYDAGTALIFSTVLSSGGNLYDAIEAARGDYGGAYSSDADLLFSYLRDNFLIGSLDSGYIAGVYIGDDLDYNVYEDDMTVNGRTWRYCDVYIYEGDGGAYVSLMFWMEGDDMALVIIGGIAEDYGNGVADELDEAVFDIIFSLELEA